MNDQQRGRIRSIFLHIEYPDGQTKSLALGEEWISAHGAILWDESCMAPLELDPEQPSQKALFAARESWQDSPTFLAWKKSRDPKCSGQCHECCACHKTGCSA